MKALCGRLAQAGHSYCKVMTAFEVGKTTPGHSGELILKPLNDGRTMQLIQQIEFVDSQGRRWTVPVGTRTDGASIPRPLWSFVGSPFTGTYLRASVIHDHYVSTKYRSWMDTHDVFYDVMVADGTDRQHALLMWAAVYRFGPRWSKDQSMCWGACACSDVFVERLDIVPTHSEEHLARIKAETLNPNATQAGLRELIEKQTWEAAAGMRGYIHMDDCEREPHKRKYVDEIAVPNWPSIGDYKAYRFVTNVIYRVVDVDSSDVLNIRSAPSGGSEVIGEIPANASGIRVIGKCDTWCKVNYRSRIGWVFGGHIAIDYDASRLTGAR